MSFNYLLLVYLLLPLSEINSTSERLFHEFHMSKCDIDFNSEENALQISISLFIDDLELALSKEGNENLYLCTSKEADQAENLIHQFITDHLVIKVDGERKPFRWVGKEVSDDLAAVWCYLEIVDVSPEKIIEVKNDVLMELFSDQQNIVKLVFDKKRKSFFLFNVNEHSGSLELK